MLFRAHLLTHKDNLVLGAGAAGGIGTGMPVVKSSQCNVVSSHLIILSQDYIIAFPCYYNLFANTYNLIITPLPYLTLSCPIRLCKGELNQALPSSLYDRQARWFRTLFMFIFLHSRIITYLSWSRANII